MILSNTENHTPMTQNHVPEDLNRNVLIRQGEILVYMSDYFQRTLRLCEMHGNNSGMMCILFKQWQLGTRNHTE